MTRSCIEITSLSIDSAHPEIPSLGMANCHWSARVLNDVPQSMLERRCCMKSTLAKHSLKGLLAVLMVSLAPTFAKADHFHGGFHSGGFHGGFGHFGFHHGFHDHFGFSL